MNHRSPPSGAMRQIVARVAHLTDATARAGALSAKNA